MFTAGNLNSPKSVRTSNWSVVRCASPVWGLLILPLFAVYASSGRAQELRAEKIYGWGFYQSEDQNSNLWPDRWQRRRDRNHPAYIDMRIVPRDLAVARKVSEAKKLLIQAHHAWETGTWDPNYVAETTPPDIARFLDRTVLDSCMEVRMDGGAAELISPIFDMDPRFSHQLGCEISCDDLNGHAAWVELQMLDEDKNVLETVRSRSVSGTADWQQQSIRAESPPMGKLRWGRIHIRIEPRKSLHIAGVARFDNLSIHRMPRLALSSELKMNVAEPGQEITITCTAMGIKSDVNTVQFELLDEQGRRLRQETIELKKQYVSPQAEHLVFKREDRPYYAFGNTSSDAYDGSSSWKLVIDDPGLYRVTVNLGRNAGADQRRALLLAVMRDEVIENPGPFGWSIPAFGSGLKPVEIPELVTRFGAGWVKYPIWYDMTDSAQSDQLVNLTERLQAFDIKCVGRLDTPPPSQRQAFGNDDDELHAVTVFRDVEAWEPLLEPVLTRMGMRLTWFQLGGDHDVSFMGTSDVVELLTTIRARMQTYCQELRISIGWDWLEHAPPTSTDSPWNSIHYRTAPQLTAAELRDYAQATSEEQPDIWVNIDPLPASTYSLHDRVQDLTERMIEVRKGNVRAAFLTNPFDPERGLFTADKNAGEMLIPWHSLVTSIGGRQFVGSINMPHSSANHIFSDGNDGVMLMWNSTPVQERLFLGKNISATDVWGKPLPVSTVTNRNGMEEQVINVGEWPLIIRGVNVEVVRWRQFFELKTDHLASRVGAAITLPVSLTSPFEQSISGTMTLVSDTLLAEGQVQLPLQIASGRKQDREIPLELRGDASAGTHQLRFDFDIDANERFQFSVYREITLGMGDVRFVWDSTRLSDNQILLRLELQNNTDAPISFDCKLFPPGQPYQRFQILQAAPGFTSKEFTLNVTDSGQLLEHWIRCEGIGTGRILNYRIKL